MELIPPNYKLGIAMSPFSCRIRNEIVVSYPFWEQYAVEETYKGSEPYLVITVPVPKEADTGLPLRIITWDDEITIDFDYYHTHFDRWYPEPNDNRQNSGLLYVQELIEEKFAVASWWQDNHCKVCSQVEPGEKLKPSFSIAFSTVRVRSWKGSHNVVRDA